jgi:cohesin complex subunit SCC1
MFYSDALLSKTGPLARVWLASNMERKLTKKDCIASNLENSIEVMVDQGSAPMALRLSGQLLLGVVRIYNRKARYLLEDCNEALVKIKMVLGRTIRSEITLTTVGLSPRAGRQPHWRPVAGPSRQR